MHESSLSFQHANDNLRFDIPFVICQRLRRMCQKLILSECDFPQLLILDNKLGNIESAINKNLLN